MKKLILTLALILCGYAISQASILRLQPNIIAVGSNPVFVVEDPLSHMINILCAGIDVNGNNKFDEGEDEKPSLWAYSPTGSIGVANKYMEFDSYFVNNFKSSIDIVLNNIVLAVPLKCDIVDGEFAGNGKLLLIDTYSYQLIKSIDLPNSEFLLGKYSADITKSIISIAIIRGNSNDSLVYQTLEDNIEDRVQLNGDATDFTFVDLDGDGKDEIAILIDNKTLAFYKFGETIQLITESDLTLLDDYTGDFGHLYSKGGTVYTTLGNKGSLLKVSLTLSGATSFDVSSYYSLDELSYPSSFYPINKNTQVITNTKNNLIVRNGSSIPEMHRTTTPTDFVYANETAVYVTGDKSIFEYDIKNDNKLDPSYNSHGFFGYQPVDIFPFGDNYYSVNLGVDFNFDGEIDELVGDQKPSINQFDLNNPDYLFANNYNRINFDFPINFPLNTNISSTGDIVLPSGNKAYFYNVEDNEIHDSLDAEMYVSCAFSVLDYLVLGQRDYTENKSYIRIKKGDFIDVKTEVGANVVDCIVYQNASGFGVVSLSEGNFGQPDSKINIVKLSTMGIGENTAIEVGTGGNSIVTNADQTKAAVVMNGSHEIHILNLITGEIDLTFSTGTSGYGGPRDAKFVGELLYVTTYSNEIIIFDSKTGVMKSSIMIDGNSEGLAFTENYLLATNIQYSNYQPSNRIFAYDLDKITSVEEAIPSEQTIRVYPHPVSNDFHLVSDDLAGTNDIAIINSQGKVVATYSGTSNGAIALNADALGLVSGNYTVVINGTRAVRFVVIK
ncbi:MAG: hypothetical protein CVV25_09620 [Ignavibacteriae bacterium HGW-Ignavibacteriae-4]|jgi:hypothetical protein|nr:MAG: hypothetical protein CVV25_09620 [Ignavibacteriae bacterium HGW-Ignavibacteriae-4]